jgi:hypothetical protein
MVYEVHIGFDGSFRGPVLEAWQERELTVDEPKRDRGYMGVLDSAVDGIDVRCHGKEEGELWEPKGTVRVVYDHREPLRSNKREAPHEVVEAVAVNKHPVSVMCFRIDERLSVGIPRIYNPTTPLAK